MTGLPDFNYPAFFRAEEELARLGHESSNPARNDGDTLEDAIKFSGTQENPSHEWEWYLRRDIPKVVSADALLMLPGWQDSRGANLEVHIATALGMPMYILRDGHLMPRVTVIGLSGYGQSGKDTIGNVLVNEGHYVRASFADYIREALYALNPQANQEARIQDLVNSHGWEQTKVQHPEVRGLLQRLGSEVGRNMLGENVWVDLTFRNLPDGSKVVVTDCRFPNEADTIKRLGGQMWRVRRPNYGPVNNHPSETALDDWKFDRVFENTGSMAELQERVSELIRVENL